MPISSQLVSERFVPYMISGTNSSAPLHSKYSSAEAGGACELKTMSSYNTLLTTLEFSLSIASSKLCSFNLLT